MYPTTNTALQQKVIAELNWEPALDAAGIGVACKDGIVTLTGVVKSYADRSTAQQVVQRVVGVKAVANDVEVKLPTVSHRTDTDLAQAVLRALEWAVDVPHDRIKVTVTSGLVSLGGNVDWHFQRLAAERSVRPLIGVKGVVNQIQVNPHVSTTDVKKRIEEAFERSAELEARAIRVEVENGKVVLRGKVHTWAERMEAENAAWSAPGVSRVDDQLVIGA